MERRDYIRGVLIGLAAGDRIGGPIRMALCLAESLIAQQRFDREDILRRYLSWWREEGFDTGPVSARVFQLMAAGIPDEEAVSRTHAERRGLTAGCNPAHRSLPLALAAFLALEDLPDLALREASLTHWDPLAGEVAGAGIVLCRHLILGAEWPDALRQAAIGREERTQAALRSGSNTPSNRDGFAPHVLEAAISFVGANSEFAPALEAAVAFAGPANYCPVLVGAIAGARWGAAAIPARLLTHCAILPRVETVAEALAASW